MKITGIIRTASKLHVTSATDSGTKIDSEGRFNTPSATISLSRTYRTAVFGGSGRVDIPFLPANSLIGPFRRSASSIVLSALSEQQKSITRTTFRGLTCGAGDPSPETSTLFPDEFLRSMKHPFLGLFGGGKRMYESAIKVSDLLPVVAATLEAGLVPEKFTPRAAVVRGDGDTLVMSNRVTAIDVIHRRDDALKGQTEEVMAVISDYDDILNIDMAQEAARKAQSALRRAKKAAGEVADEAPAVARVSMAQQSAREYICAGVPMYFDCRLGARATDAQVYFFALILRDVLNTNQFGGCSHLGWGRLNLADASSLHCVHDGVSAPLFSLNSEGEDEVLEISHPAVLKGKADFDAWISQLNTAELESFFLSSKVEKVTDGKAEALAEEE